MAHRRWPRWVLAIHWGFILLFVGQLLYTAHQVFVVLQPAGSTGPMWGGAATMDPELMTVRRLYAIEGWVSFIGLALYLGVVEFVPRIIRSDQLRQRTR